MGDLPEEKSLKFGNRAKAPISYYGGKQRLASRIIELIPQCHNYCEPFAGGAAVFWRLPQSPRRIDIVNDHDTRLIKFYNVLQDNKLFRKLKHKLEYTLYSESMYSLAKKILKSGNGNAVTQAWAYFVNINMAYAAAWHLGPMWIILLT